MRLTPMCYPAGLSDDELEQLINQTGLLAPTFWGDPASDFFVAGTVWVGPGGQGPSGRATPAQLTFSFPNDGTTWGLPGASSIGPNVLNAALTGAFGASDLDEGREYIRQALAAWRKYTGNTYSEVADNNSAMDQNVVSVPTRGDVRIGGRAFGTGAFLAYNAFPNSSGTGLGGGDMMINTSFFIGSAFNSTANDRRYFRNTVAHEHGHGNGTFHSVPCNDTKLMEPVISTAFNTLAIDDMRAGQRNYGDRFAGNNSPANARDFGDLTSPSLRSVIERFLSTNGATGFNNSDEDWFKFTLSSPQPVTITIQPVGGSYTNGPQSNGCSGSTSTINANQAGNLNLEIYNAAGTTLLFSSASAPAGSPESVTQTLQPGTYAMRVVDIGPSSNQTVQLYDLTIRVASSVAPPWAIAGVHKRVNANTNVFFNGSANSQTTETGATLNNNSYDWDLDGDGVIETLNNPRPTRQYPSNGIYPVTLQLTDSNNQTATDTILVTVVGATTTLTSVAPVIGEQGQTIPVVITGTNLKGVASASEFSLGAGTTFVGTPQPNTLGTQVTGLSVVIEPDAETGIRTLGIINADGAALLPNAFAIAPGTSACTGDVNGDGITNDSDLGILLDSFGCAAGCTAAQGDLNGDGAVNDSDLGLLLDNFNCQ